MNAPKRVVQNPVARQLAVETGVAYPVCERIVALEIKTAELEAKFAALVNTVGRAAEGQHETASLKPKGERR
jgi:hypothetical protein